MLSLTSPRHTSTLPAAAMCWNADRWRAGGRQSAGLSRSVSRPTKLTNAPRPVSNRAMQPKDPDWLVWARELQAIAREMAAFLWAIGREVAPA